MGRNRRSEYRYIPAPARTRRARRFVPSRLVTRRILVVTLFVVSLIVLKLAALPFWFIFLAWYGSGQRNRRRAVRLALREARRNPFDPVHPYDER